MTRFIFNTIIFTSALLLLGCGGSSSNEVGGIDGSGAPVATSTTGTIDGFGSVIVNGVRYNSDKAQIFINGEMAMEDNLQVGYQVSLTGSIAKDGTATADKIEFTPNLVGVITTKNNNTLVVMGNTVKVNNDTLFDSAISPRSIDGLAPGTRILVSGALAADGNITATRIELANNSTQQLLGFVRELNTMNMTFLVNQQRVSYAGANITLGNQNLRNGLLISVRGMLDSDQLFQATQVNRIATEFSNNIKSASIEGYITRFGSAADFEVAGILVTTNMQTRYDNGSAKNLAVGIKVEVDGKVDGNGKLLADEIEFEHKINNKIAGKITSITIQNNGGPGIGVVIGTIEVDGSSIRTTATTRYDDKGNNRIKRFNLSSLQIGDSVEVTGYSSEAGFVATKIEREDKKDDELNERELEGIVTSINSDSFTLFGRKITTDADTQYRDANGNPISASTFFTIAFGKRVEVRGLAYGNEFLAIHIQIDEDDNGKNQFKL
ncbi:MAG: hypothetical protein B0W54_19610 [Cellvibrio sp. 79]|nr:MAG: hypothetical protein B0W54_19610 [Cellvibrio sp. 79]